MNDDYLWDRSGTADPELARLESLLGRYRHHAPLRAPRRPWRVLAAAAALVLLLGGGLLAYRFLWPSGEAWPVTIVSGASVRHERLAVGEELRTDGHSTATLQIARVGEVEVGPGSAVTLLATSSRRHRMRLDRGTLVARTWAPPFTFSVETPSGLASDIGCAFTLRHAGNAGEVHVTSGWVDFDGSERSSLIPAGALVDLRGDNPGSPYYSDATAEFRAALRAYDFDRGPLAPVLAAVRPRDAMTLLHLLERAEGEERGRVFDVLQRIAPAPHGVTREGVLGGDLEMVDAWRRSLGLGGYKKWWLYWRDAL